MLRYSRNLRTSRSVHTDCFFMKYLALIPLFFCSLIAHACSFPTMPHKDFFNDYKQVFEGVVVGVNLSQSNDLVGDFVANATLKESERKIIVSDGGPAYEVRAVITKIFKGKSPSQRWLSVKVGCHNEAPSLLEKGIFAIDEHGDVFAGYEHQSEFFDYAAVLHDLQTFSLIER